MDFGSSLRGYRTGRRCAVEIGTEQPAIVIEPIVEPVPGREEAPATPDLQPGPERDPIPA
jgi:hypothetical protein